MPASRQPDKNTALLIVDVQNEFCVLHTALDARSLGYELTIIESGCRGIDADGSLAAAWARMVRAG